MEPHGFRKDSYVIPEEFTEVLVERYPCPVRQGNVQRVCLSSRVFWADEQSMSGLWDAWNPIIPPGYLVVDGKAYFAHPLAATKSLLVF